LILFSLKKDFSNEEIDEFKNPKICENLKMRQKIRNFFKTKFDKKNILSSLMQKKRLFISVSEYLNDGINKKKIIPLKEKNDYGEKTLKKENEIFSVFKFSKIKEIIEKYKNEKFKDIILPENAKNCEIEKIIFFMEIFAAKIWKRYYIKDGEKCEYESMCGEMSTFFLILARTCGIDAYTYQNLHRKEIHIFNILKIEDKEFRIDFTASQYFKGNVGIFITPRSQKTSFNFYDNEKYECALDFRIHLHHIIEIFSEIVEENNL